MLELNEAESLDLASDVETRATKCPPPTNDLMPVHRVGREGIRAKLGANGRVPPAAKPAVSNPVALAAEWMARQKEYNKSLGPRGRFATRAELLAFLNEKAPLGKLTYAAIAADAGISRKHLYSLIQRGIVARRS